MRKTTTGWLMAFGCLWLAHGLTAGEPSRGHQTGLPALPAATQTFQLGDWDRWFLQGKVFEMPQGKTKGTVVYTDGLLPKGKARTQSLIWKGKIFEPDGQMNNRWALGFVFPGAKTTWGNSVYDGKPCLVIEYPPDHLAFPDARDEIRQIAPGVWLGRTYQGTARPNFSRPVWKGYFVLQAE